MRFSRFSSPSGCTIKKEEEKINRLNIQEKVNKLKKKSMFEKKKWYGVAGGAHHAET